MRVYAGLGGACSAVALVSAVLSNDCIPFSTGGTADASVEEAALDASPNTCAADLSADARNCGTCGRDCGGGTCTGGQCGPYVIADSGKAVSAWYIAVDDVNVYWTSLPIVGRNSLPGDGKVRAAPKLGGPSRIVADTATSFDIAVLGESVFFTAFKGEVPGLHRVSKSGGEVTTMWGGSDAFDLAIHSGKLYFTGGGAVRALTLPAQIETVTTASASAEGITVDDEHVYWAEHYQDDGGVISRFERATQKLDELEPVQPGARRMTSDADAIYWTASAPSHAIMRRSKRGGPALRLFEGESHYGSIVVDDQYLYVAAENEARIMRMNKVDGSERVDLATGLRSPIGLAQDPDALYFTERVGGLVKRLRK
jgi:hypothetical protein